MEQRGHFRHVVRHHQGVGFAGRLERIVAGGRHPVMLQIVPLATQGDGVHRARVAVAGQDAGRAHPENVDVVALADAEDQWFERDAFGLRDPGLLIAIQIQDLPHEDVRHHAGGLRQLVGNLARILRGGHRLLRFGFGR